MEGEQAEGRRARPVVEDRRSPAPATHAGAARPVRRGDGAGPRVRREEDLFAPAGEDGRTTIDVKSFLAAQEAWLAAHLPANGVILERDEHGQARLPKGARPVHGESEPGDLIGHAVAPEDGRIRTCAFRMPEAAATRPVTASARAPRPAVTRKGQGLIGELRTEALRQALGEAEIDGGQLIGLLVLALAGRNVEVHSAEGGADPGARQAIAREIAKDGALSGEMTVLRGTARAMLAHVLSCRADASSYT